MNYLLDTCVLSEFTRRKPEAKVVQWMREIDDEKLYISVVTIGEIQHGIERLVDSRRKNALLTWMNDELVERFGPRALSIDTQTMLTWGSLVARVENEGHPMALMDSLVAAITLQYNLILVTRNVSDFHNSGVQLINPWE